MGQQYTTKLHPVGNADPDKVKIWLSLDENSDGVWTMSNVENEMGQESILQSNHFDSKEGVHHAAFLRDVNTPNVNNPLLRGKHLRSRWLVMKLENASTVPGSLFSVNVYYIPSERSDK